MILRRRRKILLAVGLLLITGGVLHYTADKELPTPDTAPVHNGVKTRSLKNNYAETIVSPSHNTSKTVEASDQVVDKKITKRKIDIIAQRAKFQQVRVEKFCNRYNLNTQKLTLPEEGDILYDILLLNKDTRVLYCAPPKTGCTHLKIAFLASVGKLNASIIEKNGPVNDIIRDAVALNTISQLDSKKQEKALHSHYKYLMYRNPLERLASGYRDKVERYPLQGLEPWTPLYNWVKMETYKYTHLDEYREWFREGGETEVVISFPDFVDYWVNTSARHDAHFEPIHNLCSPCRVRYDYYGNFKTFNRDARVLLAKIHGNTNFLREGYYVNQGRDYTATVTKGLYGQLSLKQRVNVLRKLSQDLDFYYHIFPDERNSHKKILGIDNDLTVPYD